jgi:hypothetical protein
MNELHRLALAELRRVMFARLDLSAAIDLRSRQNESDSQAHTLATNQIRGLAHYLLQSREAQPLIEELRRDLVIHAFERGLSIGLVDWPLAPSNGEIPF